MALVETVDLCKHFGGVQATRNVSLAVERGECRGLIGPNGAGKTTLANLITAVYPPSAGEVRLEGRRIDGERPNRVARRGMLRTFQGSRLFGNLTALENLLVTYDAWRGLGGSLRGGGEGPRRAGELLALTRLEEIADLPARQLSGGQQALLQLASGFMHPKLAVYVLDEPFAGINPVFVESIVELLLHERRERGITYLIISHEMEIMRRLCDRVSVMIDGAVFIEGTLDEVTANDAVIDAYLGR